MTTALFSQPLKAQRLRIRIVTPQDGALLFEAAQQSLAVIQPWLAWAKKGVSLAAFEDFCREKYGRYWLNEEAVVLFLLKTTGALAGCASLKVIDWPLRQFQIGYWGHINYSGQGFMKEGLIALTNHALTTLQANRVALKIDARNQASWRLAESAGFELEGVLQAHHVDVNGHLCASRIYAKTVDPSLSR